MNRKEKTRQLPKYEYPNEVLTASKVGWITKYGIEFKVAKEDCFFYRALDEQRNVGKSLFGGGYLLSEKAAAEKAAAEKWQLSDREWLIVKSLGKK